MVVWSQIGTRSGCFVGPLAGGSIAQTTGHHAIGLAPLLAAVPVLILDDPDAACEHHRVRRGDNRTRSLGAHLPVTRARHPSEHTRQRPWSYGPESVRLLPQPWRSRTVSVEAAGRP